MEEEILPEIQAQKSPEEELREAQEASYAFRKLLECQGWGLLVRLAQEQVKYRNIEASKLASSIDEAVMSEMLKREIAGINLILNYPALIVREMDENIKDLKEQIGETENVE